MPINPLQLPTWHNAPQVDFSPLDKIGEAFERAKLEAKEKAGDQAHIGLVDSVTQKPGQQPATPGAPSSGQLSRGLRNNNPGNLKDGALAKSLPGYKGADEGFAVFETPDHGLGAMDHLLTSYGRRGARTAREIIGGWKRDSGGSAGWAPASDGNDVETYAKYLGNGNPDAEIDLSNPQTRKELAQRIGRYENGMAPRVGPAAGANPQSPHGMPPEMADRVKGLFASGSPKARELGIALLGKYIGKQEPIKLGAEDTLVHPETYQTLATGGSKPMSVRAGGSVVDPRTGKVLYQAPASAEDQKPTIVAPGSTAIDRGGKPIYTAPDRPQSVAPGASLVQGGQPIYTAPDQARTVAPGAAIVRDGKVVYQAPDRTEPGFEPNPEGGLQPIKGGSKDPKYIANTKGEKALPELTAERKAEIVKAGLDPNDPRFQAYIITGKLPGEDKMPITPTDKKAIMEADEHVVAHNQVITNIKDLKEMSKKSWGFPGSGRASKVLSPFNQTAQDTQELNTTATANALAQLKSIFGGAPTEGERKILLDIQGSSAMPDALRQKVYDRAIKAAETRLELAQKQADSIRDRTYWKPGGGMSAAPAATLSKERAQGTPTDPAAALAEARAAIGAGAKREQVIQRLQELGIDPRGL